jgi:methylmalonyl-CoA mutase
LKINEEQINEFLGNIHFYREIQGNYLYEISLGRAQRIVWRNILQAFEIDNPAPPLFITTLPVIKNGLNDHFLIEATTKMLSAILGGSDTIYLEFDEINEEMRIENLAHIFHIFTLESGIGEVIDPVAGSFYVDELTTKLAQQIWSKLKS